MSTHVRGQNFTYSIANHIGIAIADHKKVADTIIAGKVDLAGEAMRTLIQEAMDLICKREAQERRAAVRPLCANRP